MTNRRALIVDDSRATRSLLKRVLTKLGFETFEAEHGQDALNRLEEHGSMELALVDWNMPVMDGLAFIKAVRAEFQYESMALVMVTSESDPVAIGRALMAGADEYAIKPVTVESLSEKLELAGVELVGAEA